MMIDYEAEDLPMVACKAGACAIPMAGDTLLTNQGLKNRLRVRPNLRMFQDLIQFIDFNGAPGGN
jgi:hypothetical protein